MTETEVNSNTEDADFTNSNRHASIKGRIKRFIPKRLILWLTYSRAIVWLRSYTKGWLLRNQDHNTVYGKDYFEMVDSTTGQSAQIMAGSLVHHLHPKNVVDLGCGTGNLLNQLRELGVKSKGAEYADAAMAYCQERGLDVISLDFTKAEDLARPLGEFDLAVSTEVAIQLAPEAATNHIKFLCEHADTVLFSSPPCARDRRPKSPQTAEHWQEEFANQGFRYDADLSDQLKTEWEEKGTAPWFYRRPMIFRRS
tara:strand:- start:513 stop:1274 length:762 start_codon:yes stop_codon:yes gene_type:complete